MSTTTPFATPGGPLDTLYDPQAGDAPSGAEGRAEVEQQQNAAIRATQQRLVAELGGNAPLPNVALGSTGAVPTISVANQSTFATDPTYGPEIFQRQGSSTVKVLGLAGVMLPNPRTDGGDDATAINALLDAATFGARVGAPPGAVYSLQSSVVLQPGLRYDLGASLTGSTNDPFTGNPGGATFQQAAGANLDRMVTCPAVLSTTSSLADASLHIDGLVLDGNGANQTGGKGYGLDLAVGQGNFENIGIFNTRGHGLVLEAANAAGTAYTGITHENVFHGKIKISGCGGHGFWSQAAWTDGTIEGLMAISNVGLSAAKIDNGGGWRVTGIHAWSVGADGILIVGGAATRALGNYVEGFGANTTAAAYGGATTYAMYAVVISGGQLYWSTADGNVGHAVTDTAHWLPVNNYSNLYGLGVANINGMRGAIVAENQVSIGHQSISTLSGIGYRCFLMHALGSSYAHFHHNTASNEYQSNNPSASTMAWRFALASGVSVMNGANLGTAGGLETNLANGTFAAAPSIDSGIAIPGLTSNPGNSSVPKSTGAILTSGTVTVPAGITLARITCVGGHGSGASGGSPSSAILQASGGGGGAGAAVREVFAVTAGATLTVTIGAGGTGPTGAAAGGHPGLVGNAGTGTVVTGTGVSLTAPGGGPGGAPLASSVTPPAGGTPGGGYAIDGRWPGTGGGGSFLAGGSPNGESPGGAGAGGAATTTLGGLGGAAGTASTGGAAGGTNSTANGTAGVNGGSGPGGGPGGGGGAGATAAGTGGNGGSGGNGYALIEWIG